MLPSWRSRYTITLSPKHLTVIETKKGWRPSTGELTKYVVEPCEGKQDWQLPLATLAQWLEVNKQRQADITIVIADRYARYALIPWPNGITKQPELEAYSQAYFEDLYGDLGLNWTIQTDWSRYATPAIGCALPRKFIDGIRQLFAKHSARLISLQPHFATTFNRYRHRFDHQEALLVVMNSGQCTFASFKNNEWQSIRSIRTTPATEAELQSIIERERLLQGLDKEAHVFLHLDESLAIKHLQELDSNVTLIGSPPMLTAKAG